MLDWFSGIGSRECPVEILRLLSKYTAHFCAKGYGLRSGGADGADKACEFGCNRVNGKKEIFLPKKGFNGNDSPLYHVCDKALRMAEEYHPAWNKCTPFTRLLMARNCYQVLGQSLEDPVKFILCWTSDGKASGGTGQALRIAADYDIKIYNLFKEEDLREVSRL